MNNQYSEKQKHDSFWEFAAYICNMMEEEGINYVVIKTVKKFRYYDGNLDVLIHPDHCEKAKRFLGKYKRSTSKREPHKVMYSIDENGVKGKLHYHPYISWNGVIYGGANKVKEIIDQARVYQYEGYEYKIPKSDHEIEIIALHSIFENYCVKAEDVYELSKLKSKTTYNISGFGSCVVDTFSKKISKIRDLSRRTNKSIETLTPSFYKTHVLVYHILQQISRHIRKGKTTSAIRGMYIHIPAYIQKALK